MRTRRFPASTRRKPMRTILTTISSVVAVVAALGFAYATFFPAQARIPADTQSIVSHSPSPAPQTTETPSAATNPSGTGAVALNTTMVQDAITELPDLPVKVRTKVPGYERGCKAGQGCVFGPAWTDDTSAPGGHNGCDTRNDVLHATLSNIEFKGTSKCVVTRGTYVEPYFGTAETFVKGEPTATQDEVDHTYPLAAAWDMGADTWSIEKRKAFANDIQYELVLTTHAINDQKSALTAGEWLPLLRSPAAACNYAARYVLTASRYGLPITPLDKTAISKAFTACR